MLGTPRSVDDGLTRRVRRSLAGLATRHARRRPRRTATLELLEGRTLLTTFTVTSTGTGNVAGTLLYEIDDLNSTGGSSNIINFTLGSGVQTISPTSALPTITEPVTIEGTASGGVPQIQILGDHAGSGASGLTFGSGSSGSSVQDLVIGGFAGDGIDISSTGASVLGCWLGIKASGSEDGNGAGIDVNASGATIGGTTTGAGNVISGNMGTSGPALGGIFANAACLIEGNKIGTNAAGTASVPNVVGIFVVAANATIGGTAAGAGNVISGNAGPGVYIFGTGATGTVVEGNLVGLTANGTQSLANEQDGIEIAGGATGNTIGGTASGAGNVSSGNEDDGIEISGPGTNFNLVVGNEIGTNAAGTAAVKNHGAGIEIDAGAQNNTIGGAAAADRNLASGNSGAGIAFDAAGTGNVAQGNWAGLNALGNGTISNNVAGIVFAEGSSGNSAIDNVASGNQQAGILIGTYYTDTGSSGNVVQGNVIGTDPTGTYALGNLGDGVLIEGTSSGNTIGGTTIGAANIIAGNTSDGVYIDAPYCLVEGNEIGTNAAGTAAVANLFGIYVDTSGSGTTIGGTTAGTGNVISGNTVAGIQIDASCLVEGNEIGTNTAGTAAVPNGAVGIYVVASSATIGGTTAGAGNTISENGQAGIAVAYGATATITNDSITADGTGILVGYEADDTCLVTAQYDDLSGNTTAGITNNQTNASYAVTATYDWWGSLLGPTTPANPDGNGTSVSANVNFSPWIGVQLVANGMTENLDWIGTLGSDQVQFIQTAAGTVRINVTELAGIATSLTATITGVTGSVVANEYDVAGDADVVDGSGLTTIPSVITVGNGNDTVIGGGGANTIVAGDGANTIYGNGIGNSPNAPGVQDPSNTINVGNGNNIIFGNYSGSGYQGGNNTITAGDGNNTIYGNYGNGGYTGDGAEGSNNTITVGDGANTIYGNYGEADGGEGGSNTIIAGDGNDIIYGNAGGDDPQRKGGNNFIEVGNGNDTIYGNFGGDGGEGGDNTILTGSGQDTIYGNFGGDGGEGGNNLIVAGGGNDIIYAHCALPATSTTSGATAEGRDLIIGGTGSDTVYGWPTGYTLGSNTGGLFVAGATNLSLSSLDAVLAEWDSSDDYATRVADLSGTNGPVGANGSNYLISGTTVFSSAAVDEVFGTVGFDDDWYLVTSNDVLNDVNPNEVTLIN